MQMFIRLCKVDDVKENEPIAVSAEGFPPLAAYNVSGEYFVTDDNCTHGNGQLSEGFQEGSIIECPFHGGAFDIKTGAVKEFPCKIAVRSYPVSIDDGWITIPSAIPN